MQNTHPFPLSLNFQDLLLWFQNNEVAIHFVKLDKDLPVEGLFTCLVTGNPELFAWNYTLLDFVNNIWMRMLDCYHWQCQRVGRVTMFVAAARKNKIK